MKPKGIIYLIINSITGEKYIGLSHHDIKKAWKNDVNTANRMSKKVLSRAIRHYKTHNFIVKELETIHNIDHIEERYEYWVDRYKPVYNNKDFIFEWEKKKEEKPEPIMQIEPEPEEESEEEPEPIKKEKNTIRKGHIIKGINHETGEIKEWNNARECAKEIASDPNKNGNVIKIAKKGNNYKGWGLTIIEENRRIMAMDKKTWKQYYFDSLEEVYKRAGLVKSQCRGLFKSLESNGRSSWRGYRWYYIDNEEED